ncbi:unnamed protein product [Arabis nemorensis]|uniref:Peptidase M16 N-terminal domain-containing protein n=1 Tax=Arabis nemorensis TaxID=586526 RepID=A0A565CGX4_9BRAS|nr:unnamed protein product [Arabis nemorensis]
MEANKSFLHLPKCSNYAQVFNIERGSHENSRISKKRKPNPDYAQVSNIEGVSHENAQVFNIEGGSHENSSDDDEYVKLLEQYGHMIGPPDGDDSGDSSRGGDDSPGDDDSRDIIIPEGSSKQYKSLQLENGLEVILVFDPGLGTRAVAAMIIRVDSLFDHVEVLGLAHLFEHLVFRGTNLFLGEKEFEIFLSEHGGMTNGFTELEHTCFTMEVQQKYLKGALERFSMLFIAHLLHSKSVKNEINAIDAEFKFHMQDDNYGLAQLKGHSVKDLYPISSRIKVGWISSLSATFHGDQFDATSSGRAFSITIELTKSGLEKYNLSFFHLILSTKPIIYYPAKRDTKFTVTDDLIITPMNSSSAFCLLKKLQNQAEDLEVQEIRITKTEAASLLRASLVTSSALNTALWNLIAKNPKEET